MSSRDGARVRTGDESRISGRLVSGTNVATSRGAGACGAGRSMSFGPVALPEACRC